MANCLLTQLKGTSTNDNLAKLGELRAKWKFVSDGYNRVSLGTSQSGNVLACTNLTAFLNLDNTERTNPFTMNRLYQNVIKPNKTDNTSGVFTISNRYTMTVLVLSNMSECNLSLEDIVEYSSGLSAIGLHQCDIYGDLLSLANKDSITSIALSYLNKRYIKNGNVRNLINAIAQRRTSGTLSFVATNGTLTEEAALSDIPVGINLTNMISPAIIYFSQSYPDGWYVKAPNGTYYNSNGEVITP